MLLAVLLGCAPALSAGPVLVTAGRLRIMDVDDDRERARYMAFGTKEDANNLCSASAICVPPEEAVLAMSVVVS